MLKSWFNSKNETKKYAPGDCVAGVHLSMQQLLQCQQDAAMLAKAPRIKQQAVLAGGHESRFKGRGMDFDETRLYQPGDDIRSIDWNVTARTNEPHTKIYREERERPIHVFLDQSSSLFFSSKKALKSTTLAQAAALLTWASIANNNRVGCILADEYSHMEFRPAAQRSQIMRIFRATIDRHNQKVATIFGNPQSEQALSQAQEDWFARALGRLKKVARTGSLVYILSDFRNLTESAKRQIARIARHCEVHAFCISDPLEKHLPPTGRYAISDGLHAATISTHSRALRHSFNEQAENFSHQLHLFMQKHRVSLVEFQTDQVLTDVMRNSLVKFQMLSDRGR